MSHKLISRKRHFQTKSRNNLHLSSLSLRSNTLLIQISNGPQIHSPLFFLIKKVNFLICEWAKNTLYNNSLNITTKLCLDTTLLNTKARLLLLI